MSKLIIIPIALIIVIALFLHFHTPSEPVNNTFNNIILDGELDAILNPYTVNKSYKGIIVTGKFKGTATVKNLTGEFDITITNANFNGMLYGKVNNDSLFNGKVEGTASGHIQGTYKIKKQTNYLFWAIVIFSFLLPSIIVIIYLKYKKEPDIDIDEKERIATEWLKLNISDTIKFYRAVTYPKNTTTFFFTGEGMECYSIEITYTNKTKDPVTYDNKNEMKEEYRILKKLKLMIVDEIKIKKKKRGGF